MRSALLTGATGFIGSWLTEELVRQNVSVTALVCEGAERLPKPVRGAIQIVDYDPENIMESATRLIRGYDAFFNLGWGGVSPEKKNNISIQLSNVEATLKALELACELRCKRFLGIGTVGEYVFSQGLISDQQPPSPQDIYGAAKVAAHFMGSAYARHLGIDFNWVILCSTYGERRTDNNIITYTIKTLLDGGKPSYSSLEQMWDFLYISDVVRALYLVAEKGRCGTCYGVGSGVFHPLSHYIETIRDKIDPSLPLGIGERAAGGNALGSSCVDNRQLAQDTGFSPQIPFEEGIRKTIEYFRNGEL